MVPSKPINSRNLSSLCGYCLLVSFLPVERTQNYPKALRFVLAFLTLNPIQISKSVIHSRYKCMTFKVGRKGFEPSAFRLSVERSAKLSYRPINRINMTIFIRVDMKATDKNAFKSCSKLSNLLIGISDKKCRYCHKNQK